MAQAIKYNTELPLFWDTYTDQKEEQTPKTSIVVPAYNEELGLPVVMNNLLDHVDSTYELVVVDDGSTDATKMIAAGFPCTVISHGVNRGKGEALKTGVALAEGENIVTIDADDTYPAEAISEIVKALEEYDFVIASRSTGKTHISVLHQFGNAVFRDLIRIVSGYKLSDPLTGLYGIKKCYLKKMELSSHGFGLETEISIKAAKMGLRMKEIPITYRRRLGTAKLNGLRDGWIILTTILKFSLWRQPEDAA
jgi:glycosyltransferase involved in cell wall biosynthesis